jgi:hypothetical protein
MMTPTSLWISTRAGRSCDSSRAARDHEQPRGCHASIARRCAVDDPIHGIWVITTEEDGRSVGNLLFKPIPLSAEVEIGWHLHPDA